MILLDRWRRRRAARRKALEVRILFAALDRGSLWELRRRLPDVRAARVQRAVWDLETAGYLTSHWEDQGPGRPRRKYYRTADWYSSVQSPGPDSTQIVDCRIEPSRPEES